MKPFFLILVTLFSIAGYGQQLPSQIQAKRGVFTERLYLTDKWIDRFTLDMNSNDSTNDYVIPTAKAVADYIRSQNFPNFGNFANSDLTLTGDRYHHGAGYNIKFDSIRSFEFNVGFDNIVNHMMIDTQLYLALYTPTNSSILNFKRGQFYGAVTDALGREDTFDFTNFLYTPLSAGWSIKRHNGTGYQFQGSELTSLLDSTYNTIEYRDKNDLSLFNRTRFYQTLTGFKFAADGSLNPSLDFNLINLPLSSDVINSNPIGIDNYGKLYRMNNWGNFATENLTLTGNRFHSLGNHTLNFEGAGPFYKSRSAFNSEDIIFSLYDTDEYNDYNKVHIQRGGTSIENRSTLANTISSIVTHQFGVELNARSLTTFNGSQIRADPEGISFSQVNSNYRWGNLKQVTNIANLKPLAVDYDGYMYKLSGWPQGTGTALPQGYAQVSTVTVSGSEEKSLTESGSGSLTIPASTWVPGKTYRITIHGSTATQLSDTTDLKISLKLGSTTIASTQNLKFFPGTHQFSATVDVSYRTTWAGGAVYAFGTLTTNNNVYDVNNNGFDWSLIDTTVDQTFDITMKMIDDSYLRRVTAFITSLEEIH